MEPIQGNVSIDAQNIMPIIKKWLYSDKDIFIREVVSNGWLTPSPSCAWWTAPPRRTAPSMWRWIRPRASFGLSTTAWV